MNTQSEERDSVSQSESERETRDDTQFLTFRLGNEQYGIDILRIQEIRGWEPVSRVPNVPFWEKGVLNLRGVIVPVIDLRERLGFESAEYGPVTAVIVIRVIPEQESRIMGLVVDEVSDVADVELSSLQSAPDFGEKVNTEFISSLVTGREKMIRVLNVDRLVPSDAAEGD